MLTQIMDSVLNQVAQFEDKLRIIHSKLDELARTQKRNQEKIMEGFRCIEKAFKLNCSAQMSMSEALDEATGTITDFDNSFC